MSFLKRVFKKRARKNKVICGNKYITVIMPSGEKEIIYWADINEIDIVTIGNKSFSENIFWLLLGNGVTCGIPGAAEGIGELVPHLCQLPNFNNDMFIEAMKTTHSSKFVCWQREKISDN